MSRFYFLFFFVISFSLTVSAQTLSIVSHTGALCTGNCSGQINSQYSGGTAPYQYSIDGGNTWQSSGSFTGLCAGSYTITATDALNNTLTATTSIISVNPIVYSLSSTNCTAWNLCNGTISVSVSGGIAPYTYVVTSSTSTATYTVSPITGLCPGTYTVTVQDTLNCPGGSCTGSPVVTITAPAPPALSASITPGPAVCPYNCQTATLAASGGLTPYQYSFTSASGPWSGTATSGCKTGSSVTGWVKDAAGSVVAATASTGWPQPFTASVTWIGGPWYCGYPCNMYLQASVSGGVAPYQYDFGQGWQSSSTSNTPLCGAAAVTVKDATGCTVTAYGGFAMQNVFPLTLAGSAACSGCNGMILAASGTFNPLPTNALFSLNGGPAQSNPLFTGLCAGSYTVTMTYNNGGCSSTAYLTLGSGPSNTVQSITTTPPTCYGSCNGYISVIGSPGYYFNSLNGGSYQTSNLYSGLCAGTYTVTTYTASSCPATSTVTVTQPAQVALSYSLSPPCSTMCNGSITAIPMPSGTYTYSLNSTTTYQSSPTFNNLCAGTYTLRLKTSQGCITTATVSLPSLSLAVQGYATTCSGNCNGSISVFSNPQGGLYQYSLFPSGPWQTSSAFKGLCTGPYTAYVTNTQNGCVVAGNSVVITQPNIVVSATLTQPTCPSVCNGSINASASPAGTYQYRINNGPLQTSSLFTGLCSGTYTISAVNAAGCVTTNTFTLTNSSVSVTAATSSTCQSSCTGSITLNPSPAGTYQYSINNGNTWFSTPTFNGLCSGTYSVSIMNAAGCIVNSTATVNNRPPVTASATTVSPNCNGSCNGSIALSATPANTYQYSINNGSTWSSSSSFNALCAGTYTVVVSDPAGCSGTTTVTLTQPPAFTVTASSVNATCPGSCNGSIQIIPSAPGTYQYSVNNVNWYASPNFTSLCAGSYTVSAESAPGCRSSATVNITEPPAITVSTVTNNPTCYGSCNGSLNAVANPSGSYLYSIDNGNTWQSNSSFTGLCAGNYTVQTEYLTGCLLSQTVALTQPPAITFSNTITTPSCHGQCSGAISSTASPAATYQYSLDNGINWQSNGNFSSLCAGNYTMLTQSASGCSSTQTISITQPLPVIASASSVSGVCQNGCSGQINLSASPSGTYQYSIDNGSTWNSSSNFTSVCSGTYTVAVMNASGCADTAITSIQPSQYFTMSTSAVNANCNASCNGSISISTSAPGTYQYSIDNGNSWSATPAFNSLCAGSYSVVTQNTAGCQQSSSVNILQPPALSLSATTVSPVCNGLCNGSIQLQSASPGTLQYSIDNGNTWQNSGSFSSLCAGTYSAQVSDTAGCLSSQTVSITQPPQVQASAQIGQPSCNGICDGFVIVNATPAGTYQYSFNLGNTWQSSNQLNGICDAGFNIVAMNSNGCSDTIWGVNVFQPPAIAFTDSVTSISCAGDCSGAILFSTSPGPASVYEFSIDSGNTWTSNSTFNQLCAGHYNLVMRDSNGCFVSANTNINEPPPISVSSFTTATSCGLCNGSASVIASGGTGSYQYNWINFSGPQPGLDLCSGAYAIEIVDSAGCRDTISISIPGSQGISIDTFTVVGSPSSQPLGSATAIISGQGPFSFLWDAATGNQTSQTAINLLPGFYCVTVFNADGCSDSSCASVPVITAINAAGSNSPIGIFPNPVHETFFLTGEGKADVRIFNALGQEIVFYASLVLHKEGTVLASSNMAPGIYFVRVETETQVVSFRIVKQ